MDKKRNDRNSEMPRVRDLISLQEASELSGLTTGYLRRLIRQKNLWGMKIGRNWVTTEQAIRQYLALKRKPGPKPKKKQN